MFTKIADWFKSNKLPVTFLAVAAGAIITAMAVSGCYLADYIKHPLPDSMVKFNDGEDKVSLSETQFVFDEYMLDVENTVEQYNASREQAEFLFDWLSAAINTGADQFASNPTIPGATIFGGVLLGLAGLFTKKPGTDREVASEKQASYNKGVETTAAHFKDLVSADLLQKVVDEIQKDGDA
jgi:hypothetical protein